LAAKFVRLVIINLLLEDMLKLKLVVVMQHNDHRWCHQGKAHAYVDDQAAISS